MCRFLCGHNFSIHLNKYLGVQLMDHMVRGCLVLLRNSQAVFQNGWTIKHPHQQWVRTCAAPRLYQHLVLSAFGIVTNPLHA